MRRVSVLEFTRWRAFFAVEGWPESRADLRAAIIASAIVHGGLSNVSDYLIRPAWNEDKENTPQDDDLQLNAVDRFLGKGKKDGKDNQ